MRTKSAGLISVLVFFLGLFISGTAAAQYAPGPDKTHHQRLYELMKDMSQEMGSMSEQMSHGDLTAAQGKEMSKKMKDMSFLMNRMSGLQSRPAMANAESQKQTALMRKQMDEMMRAHAMNPKKM